MCRPSHDSEYRRPNSLVTICGHSKWQRRGNQRRGFIPTDDRAIINLEHVLPKKPDGNWPEFTEDEVGFHTNRIGNQALLKASDNSDLRSIGFAEKKKIYAQSPYVLTSQIADLDAWTVAAIAERQKALAVLALKAWPI
jgi:hypothetical protein